MGEKIPGHAGFAGGGEAVLEGELWLWRQVVQLPVDLVSVDLGDQRADIELGVAAGEAADARGQQQDGVGREELPRMCEHCRAGGRPGVYRLDLDYGHVHVLNLDDGGA